MKTIFGVVLVAMIMLLVSCGASQIIQDRLAQEYVKEFPGQTKSQIFDKEMTWIKWVSYSFDSTNITVAQQTKSTGYIIGNGIIDIQPEGTYVTAKVAFTMSVEIKEQKMRVRFTTFRRWYGSKKYDTSIDDGFFRTETGAPYLKELTLEFRALVQSMAQFVLEGN